MKPKHTNRNRKVAPAVFTFIAICACSAFLAWCDGYKFDRRDTDVASWVFCTLVIAHVAAKQHFYEE